MDFSHLAFEFQWEQCFSLIDKWKNTMIDHILHIHQEKSTEIEMYKEQAEKSRLLEQTNLILNMNEYFQHPCILSNEINSFKTRLNQLKQNIVHRPLPLNIEIDSTSLKNSILIHPIFDQYTFKQRKLLIEHQINPQSIHLIATSNNQIILVNNQSKIFCFDKTIGFINEINLLDYTDEYLNDICWSSAYRNFLFLCEYSLWSLETLHLKKLAQISNKKHFVSNLTSYRNQIFLVYNQGEFIERWNVRPAWKLEKRWIKQHENDMFISISSNQQHLLFYTTKSIQICTNELIIQYTIDLTNQEHIYSNFIFLSQYQIWLTIDKHMQTLNYFHIHQRTIETFDQIDIRSISSMGDDLALITKDKRRLQIVSLA
ncbi:unnamed protein product [Adineta ricciae]|uniref:Uncharacterized protein n=2 Tax=Adineta ricciae TaxID=249248 RepID=A0A816AQC2_ADIRI|nr:unnamed protein product [Adineta ricciae]